jgi:hypothetical protein
MLRYWSRFLVVFFAAVARITAGDEDEKIPVLAFDAFSYSISRTHIYSAVGTPVGKAKDTNSPEPDDVPPSTGRYPRRPARVSRLVEHAASLTSVELVFSRRLIADAAGKLY